MAVTLSLSSARVRVASVREGLELTYAVVQQLSGQGLPTAAHGRQQRGSTSGLYESRDHGPSTQANADDGLITLLRQIHAPAGSTNGVSLVCVELRLGASMSIVLKRVGWLMRHASWPGVYRHRARGVPCRDPASDPHSDSMSRAARDRGCVYDGCITEGCVRTCLLDR